MFSLIDTTHNSMLRPEVKGPNNFREGEEQQFFNLCLCFTSPLMELPRSRVSQERGTGKSWQSEKKQQVWHLWKELGGSTTQSHGKGSCPGCRIWRESVSGSFPSCYIHPKTGDAAFQVFT